MWTMRQPELRRLARLLVLSNCAIGAYLTPAQAQLAPLPFAKPPAASPQPEDYSRYENLRWKGLNLGLPGPADTIDGQAGGLRAALADYGFGYLGLSINQFALDMRDHSWQKPQTYNGQAPSYSTVNYFALTYDTGRIGLPGGQLVAVATRAAYSWAAGGVNTFNLGGLTYYQPLFDKKLEVTVGYTTSNWQFANIYVGGSLASGSFGPNGNMFFQAGTSAQAFPTPGIMVKANLPDNFYNQVAVQRAISPFGVGVEIRQHLNGVAFDVPRAGVLAIDEFGYRVAASKDTNETWIRAGGVINSSQYVNYTASNYGRSDEGNYLLYLLADHQFLKFSPQGNARRGLYAGFSVNYAPPSLNRFSQYYEGRVYAVGLFDARPRDFMSLVGSYNLFSNDLYQRALSRGQLASPDSYSITGAYGAYLMPGVTANVGVAYTNRPRAIVYTPQTSSSVTFLSSIVVAY